MDNKQKSLAGGGGLAGIGVAVLVLIRVFAHTAEEFHGLYPSLAHSLPEIASSLDKFASKEHDNDLFVSALCNSVAGVANGASPQENVGDVLKSAVSEKLGVPLYFAQDKFGQIQATFKLSTWNGGMAAKYIQVCAKAGFPTDR
jgi:hypothetical protein